MAVPGALGFNPPLVLTPGSLEAVRMPADGRMPNTKTLADPGFSAPECDAR
jgi:hypothetical protein